MVALFRSSSFGEAGPRDERGVGDERGFTMIEMMIAVLVSLTVLGSAISVMSAVQNTYAHQMDDATVQQEARFAMDFIRRTLEQAGSNPYNISSANTAPCAGVGFQGLRMLSPSSVRVQADVGAPDGLLIEDEFGTCNQQGEDVTIAFDAGSGTITRQDLATDAAPVAWTDAVFTGLTFTYFDDSMTVTTDPESVRVVRVTITGRSRTARPGMAEGTTFNLESDVRLKAQ
jgi:prepilin-type N-terminal cleavage/methylation domain-containing protein